MFTTFSSPRKLPTIRWNKKKAKRYSIKNEQIRRYSSDVRSVALQSPPGSWTTSTTQGRQQTGQSST